MHLSQKRLQIKRNGRNLESKYCFLLNFKNFKKNSNFRKIKKIALVSETVSDRAKRTQILNHMHCHNQKTDQHLIKVKLLWECVVVVG